MGGISELSDELLIKILSYLPTKVAASTSVLSKQWQFLWMWLPNLEFRTTHESEFESLRRFLLGYLPLHRAPIIESFSLHLTASASVVDPEDVKVWVQFAVSRDVRDLHISHSSDDGDGEDILPSSLYTCKFLQTLELNGTIFFEVPRMCCLPSLKSLRLHDALYDNIDSLPWLLPNCPVLEDLSLHRFGDVGKLIVRVPSLQRLSFQIIDDEDEFVTEDSDEFVIDTPSLKYLKLKLDHEDAHISIKNMPKLKEAFVEVSVTLFNKLIGSISSVKRLTLCLSFDNTGVVFDDGFVFNKLKHLKLCTCFHYTTDVLVELLKVSPNLRVLELFTMHGHGGDMGYWNQPSSVPKCILSSLEKFKWSGYKGSNDEREHVIYILQNSYCLKTATILLWEGMDETHDIKQELELSSRASTTCQLLFH